MKHSIQVGVTEWHGAIHEAARSPPPGIVYADAREVSKSGLRLIRSPIKGYLRKIDPTGVDIIEAVISPVLTDGAWIYSLAHYAEALAFNLLGMSIPRGLRAAFIRSLLSKDNCKQLIFWSEAGLRTLSDYGRETDGRLGKKSLVIYPAVREPSNLSEIIEVKRRGRRAPISLLFNGDFFRKGGAHVVDAFERIQVLTPDVRLRLCCDEQKDFNTSDPMLRSEYLRRIRENPAITLGRVSREEMLKVEFQNADIYVLPTYAEAFGFAILEAMAHGIPVISTNYFAIPEMVVDGVSGMLIDTSKYNCDKMFPGYCVKKIPLEFHEFMSESVFHNIMRLIDSPVRRVEMGVSGADICRSKFSVSRRGKVMREVYDLAV